MIWAGFTRWFFWFLTGSVMRYGRPDCWPPIGLEWTQQEGFNPAPCLSPSSRQAQVVHVESGYVSEGESRDIKGFSRPKPWNAHFCFHRILLAKARHKASPDLMGGTAESISLWEQVKVTLQGPWIQRVEKLWQCFQIFYHRELAGIWAISSFSFKTVI